MPQASAAVLRSKPSSTSASASIRRAAPLFFSPLAALRSSEAVRSNRVIDTAAPIDAAPLKKPASSQSFTDLGILMSHSFGPLVLVSHLQSGGPISRAELSQYLQDRFPFVEASQTTWKKYSDHLVNWLKLVDL